MAVSLRLPMDYCPETISVVLRTEMTVWIKIREMCNDSLDSEEEKIHDRCPGTF